MLDSVKKETLLDTTEPFTDYNHLELTRRKGKVTRTRVEIRMDPMSFKDRPQTFIVFS